ncbi:NAD-dependent epimerase/dehydratase family protein [Fusobacterium sp. PH5-44]|uniref:NAD-dependent epimerase/dehydratase family protein n=1 Tax=unclassified Fusobacterium TaxID=2648384 RepID=UPI003D227846
MKSVLVMGGNQFVGREVAKYFIKKKYKVYVLNRGTRENLNAAIHLKVDRTKHGQMQLILKNISVDTIVDISAYTEKDSDIIQQVMKNKFKQYILISSASVYNNIHSYPVNENDFIGENLIWGDYAKNKYLAEEITRKNSFLYNFKYTIFRPFYIYGIGNNLHRENYFFSRIKYDLPIYIPNKGEEIVQFGYIEDLVKALEMSVGNQDFYNNIFNISGDESVTFNRFINICGEVIGKTPIKKYINTTFSDIKARDWFPFRDTHLFGDISKIKNLGFTNEYSLFDGLTKVYNYSEINNLLNMPVLHYLEKIFK